MTLAELEFLRNSMRDAGDAFARNRELGTRQKENELDRAMRRDFVQSQREEAGIERGFRAGEADKDRAARQSELQEQRDWRAEMKAAQSAATAEQREAQTFRLLGEMNEAGALTDEGIAYMQAQIEKKFGPTGLGVKLFRRPPERPASRSSEAQNLALAEDYRARAAASKDPAEKARLLAIAERLERGGTPAPEQFAEITEPFGPDDPGTMPGDRPKVTRKIPIASLEQEMLKRAPEAPTDAKARKPGTVYQTPKGPMKWTGTGWLPVAQPDPKP